MHFVTMTVSVSVVRVSCSMAAEGVVSLIAELLLAISPLHVLQSLHPFLKVIKINVTTRVQHL